MSYFQFDEKVAVAIGVDEAIVLNKIRNWVKYNHNNDRNYYDGKTWMYNTIEAWTREFPFWKKWKVRDILKRLHDSNYIEIGYYNKSNWNRTKWYTITSAGERLFSDYIYESGKEPAQLPQEKETETTVEAEVEDAPFSSTDANDAWNAYLKMRAEMDRPLIDEAKKMTLERLEELAPHDENKKTEILKRSVRGGWKDVYPLPTSERNEAPTAEKPTGNQNAYFWPDLPDESEVVNNDEC